MEDTRLDIGAIYQPYYPWFGEGCTEGRNPRIGQYERPIDKSVFNRHIDQMSGFGIERVMIENMGQEAKNRQNERFLETELADQVDLELFYTFSVHLWGLEAPEVESYREELLRPHMEWFRENIMKRENASSHEGKPVFQMWNPVLFERDHYNQIVEEEWGSYENFFNDMRNLLEVDGKEPYLVGGTNWWGEQEYEKSIQQEIAQQFDAVTTWTASGAIG